MLKDRYYTICRILTEKRPDPPISLPVPDPNVNPEDQLRELQESLIKKKQETISSYSFDLCTSLSLPPLSPLRPLPSPFFVCWLGFCWGRVYSERIGKEILFEKFIIPNSSTNRRRRFPLRRITSSRTILPQDSRGTSRTLEDFGR